MIALNFDDADIKQNALLSAEHFVFAVYTLRNNLFVNDGNKHVKKVLAEVVVDVGLDTARGVGEDGIVGEKVSGGDDTHVNSIVI